MKNFTVKKDIVSDRAIVADDMILTKDMPTAAGSKMLDGYQSLFEAEALTRLADNGYTVIGKADVGEFAIDLLGETSYNGANYVDGKLTNAAAEIVKAGDAVAALCLDVNGSVRRAAAQSGLVSIKPTYGTVSRYGTVPVACSGETVSVLAKSADECGKVLGAIAGHDDKDGTSLSDDLCAALKGEGDASSIRRIAVLRPMVNDADDDVKARIDRACEMLKGKGVEIESPMGEVIAMSSLAWNILMTAELCNNVSRYDGVKYGYRSQNFKGLDELYTNSRTEAFGDVLKTAIIFGSETLSTENYMKVYDKALRTRRVVTEAFAKLFESYDAVMIPACSKMAYTEADVAADKYLPFEENYFTAPASITGLPAAVAGGVQIIGKAFSDRSLLRIAKIIEEGV